MLGCPIIIGAACPRWEQFMEEVFPDPDLRHYVHKAVGYSLTGDIREQCFFFLYGTGHNGKSKFIETIEFVMGELVARAGKGIVSAAKWGDYPLREMADIPGARLVLASETEEDERLNESVIKDLTGGDSLRAERKYEHAFVFRPVAKLWIYGNHKPTIRGTDCGIWRRVRLIPFTRTFEGSDDDPRLGDKLREEASGILNWAIRGCLLWQAEGLRPPKIVQLAVSEYRSEQDVLSDFIAECTCEMANSQTPHGDLFDAYRHWAAEDGIRFPFSSRLLAKKLRERGWHEDRTKTVKILWMGIKLLEG
jgi:putative DNA primase/helicase